MGTYYIVRTRVITEAYADIIKSYGFNVEICKPKFVGSYEV